jgi:hypothetical protein
MTCRSAQFESLPVRGSAKVAPDNLDADRKLKPHSSAKRKAQRLCFICDFEQCPIRYLKPVIGHINGLQRKSIDLKAVSQLNSGLRKLLGYKTPELSMNKYRAAFAA